MHVYFSGNLIFINGNNLNVLSFFSQQKKISLTLEYFDILFDRQTLAKWLHMAVVLVPLLAATY